MAKDLERLLDVWQLMDNIEIDFDNSLYSTNTKSPLKLLRHIKLFLYNNWRELRKLTKHSYLDSTDCLTLAAITNLLAYRKGIKTNIVRPNQITKYFHAMLEYESEKGKRIFQIAGSNRNYNYSELSISQIKSRIIYTRPLFNLINLIRGI